MLGFVFGLVIGVVFNDELVKAFNWLKDKIT